MHKKTGCCFPPFMGSPDCPGYQLGTANKTAGPAKHAVRVTPGGAVLQKRMGSEQDLWIHQEACAGGEVSARGGRKGYDHADSFWKNASAIRVLYPLLSYGAKACRRAGASGQCRRSRCSLAAIHAAKAFLLQLPSPCHNSCLIKCTDLQKVLSTARGCVPDILQRPEKQAEIRLFAISSNQKTGAGSHGIGSGRFYNGAVRFSRSPCAAIQTVIPEIPEIPDEYFYRKSIPIFLR